MLVCVNEDFKYIGTEGSVEWKPRDFRGHGDFALQPEGDVTLKVVLLQNDTHAIPWTFNLRLSCTNMAGEDVANLDCGATIHSASLRSRIAGMVGVAPACLKAVRPNGELLIGAGETSSYRPLLADIRYILASQRTQHWQSNECENEVSFHIGQRVECRDGGGRWKQGVVHSLCPLKIHPDGYKSAYKYREVRNIEARSDTLAPNVREMNEVVNPIVEIVSEELVVPNANPLTDYASDIYALYLRDQKKSMPRDDYMETQVDINSRMRAILVDWMVEVVWKYQLRSETLHISVNIMDRYLSKATVMRKHLQLVGVAAMFIASKLEDIDPPKIPEWVYITDHAYSKLQLHDMECQILATLGFRILVPTALQFFGFLLKGDDCNEERRALAHYVLELGLLDIRMLQYAPSHIASSALLLSNKLLGWKTWPETMAQESGHSEVTLADCVGIFEQLWEADQSGNGKLRAVNKKFSQVSHYGVANKFPYGLASAVKQERGSHC
jgi:cyclin B